MLFVGLTIDPIVLGFQPETPEPPCIAYTSKLLLSYAEIKIFLLLPSSYTAGEETSVPDLSNDQSLFPVEPSIATTPISSLSISIPETTKSLSPSLAKLLTIGFVRTTVRPVE